eukprot:6426547-Pyramimonas_sp.AAC.1
MKSPGWTPAAATDGCTGGAGAAITAAAPWRAPRAPELGPPPRSQAPCHRRPADDGPPRSGHQRARRPAR